jgi:two-component system phosphate regulon sensor histidine kinase PhoR
VATVDDLDLLRRRVVNVVGHELRTPVTTVRGLAESLADAPDDDTRRALTDALVRSAVRLERLVDDLLLASGIFTASPVGDVGDVDLADAVRRAGWPALVTGEATAVARIEAVDRALAPMIDNARRHGEPLEVRLAVHGDRAVVDVESDGPELAEGDVALLCEPFFRGEAAVMTAPGLGLGLAISRTIARVEGGDVHAHARAGGGLVVRLELPCRA